MIVFLVKLLNYVLLIYFYFGVKDFFKQRLVPTILHPWMLHRVCVRRLLQRQHARNVAKAGITRVHLVGDWMHPCSVGGLIGRASAPP